MRAFVRPGLVALTALLVLAAALVGRAQGPATSKDTATLPAATAASAVARPVPAIFKQVLATVNGEPVTRGDLLEFLNQYQIPPDDREMIYQDAINTLINTKLVTQYLNRLKIPVSPERVDEALNNLKKQLQADGTSLQQTMMETNKTLDDIRRIYADRIRWIEFVKLQGTDPPLKKFAANHKDMLNGTQVKASHILLKVDPKATAAQREQVRQKLLAIKRDVEAKKQTFAEAANANSDDPANSQKGGGDIGYFTLGSGIVEEFGRAAFALKPGQISEPVETPYGFHLILVTDRKEGQPVDFEQNKPLILNAFAAELQKSVLAAQRKNARIEIKPMPSDLFPAAPAPTPAGTPTAQPKPSSPAAAIPK